MEFKKAFPATYIRHVVKKKKGFEIDSTTAKSGFHRITSRISPLFDKPRGRIVESGYNISHIRETNISNVVAIK